MARASAAGASVALPMRLADSLFATPVLTVPGAQRLLGVTYRSAKGNVDKLVQAGILRQAGEAEYGRSYVAEEIVCIASQ